MEKNIHSFQIQGRKIQFLRILLNKAVFFTHSQFVLIVRDKQKLCVNNVYLTQMTISS